MPNALALKAAKDAFLIKVLLFIVFFNWSTIRVNIQALVAEEAVNKFKVRGIESAFARVGESPGGSSAGPPKKELKWSPNRSNNHFQNTTRILAAYFDHRILHGGRFASSGIPRARMSTNIVFLLIPKRSFEALPKRRI